MVRTHGMLNNINTCLCTHTYAPLHYSQWSVRCIESCTAQAPVVIICKRDVQLYTRSSDGPHHPPVEVASKNQARTRCENASYVPHKAPSVLEECNWRCTMRCQMHNTSRTNRRPQRPSQRCSCHHLIHTICHGVLRQVWQVCD